MTHTINKRLEKLNISPESELGKSLKKLDLIYAQIKTTEKQIRFLKDKKQQLLEDVDIMEMLLMHKLNKDTRQNKWGKNV